MKRISSPLLSLVAAISLSLVLTAISSCGDPPSGDKATGSPKHDTGSTDVAASDAASSISDSAVAPSSSAWLGPPKAYFDNLAKKERATNPSAAPVANSSVVLVVVDAFNARHTSAYGYDRPTTPNLEHLASEGMLFTNWVSNSSWTRPSFTTMITGLPKKRHKVELTGQNLDQEIVTLAEVFQAAGYRTGGFVGNPLVRELWAFDQGFQVYEDTTKHKAFPRAKILMDKAIAWLKRGKGERPFFLMVFLTDPHTPYRPVPRHRTYLERPGLKTELGTEYPFKEYLKPLPKTMHDTIVAAYDGEVAYADEQIGRLLTELEGMGARKNTSVVVTADHGEIFGAHNCYLHGYHMWDPVLRVPFIVSSPALKQTNKINDVPHTHVDLMPTIAGLAGVEIPADKPGVSAWESAEEETGNHERPIFTQYNAHGIQRQAVRIGRWKLIHHHAVDKKKVRKLGDLSRKIPRADPKNLPSIAVDGERYELYDLIDDPSEINNLYSHKKQEPVVNALKKVIEDSFDGKVKTLDTPQLSQETLEALRAAGYIQ